MNKQRFIIILIIGLTLMNIFFLYRYLLITKEIEKIKRAGALPEKSAVIFSNPKNERIINFLKLFIKEVLKAEGEVDFETRLKLENAVREIQDKEILDQWIKFTESKTEEEAQRNVKDLLEILVNKLQIK
ncbi:MAG: hypothetical protein ACO2OW_00970 [Minisyncoccia bacterium]|jgi:hypothetical protein